MRMLHVILPSRIPMRRRLVNSILKMVYANIRAGEYDRFERQGRLDATDMIGQA